MPLKTLLPMCRMYAKIATLIRLNEGANLGGKHIHHNKLFSVCKNCNTHTRPETGE